MKITNNYLLKKLISYGVYKTKVVNDDLNNENNPIITDIDGIKKYVILDDVSDDEVYLILETKKIENLNSIRIMLKFFVVLTIICLIILFFVSIVYLSKIHF